MAKKPAKISLAPLSFEQALSGLMQVKPDKPRKTAKKPSKRVAKRRGK